MTSKQKEYENGDHERNQVTAPKKKKGDVPQERANQNQNSLDQERGQERSRRNRQEIGKEKEADQGTERINGPTSKAGSTSTTSFYQ